MSSPLVSIIIPAYKAEAFLARAIDSVLAQTYQNLEIIVVNDASPDGTAAVVRGYTDPRVKLVDHAENRGYAHARNTGMRASSGDIIALLDADDWYHPEKLALHVEFFLQRSDIGITYNARYDMHHSANTVRQIWRPPPTVSMVDLVMGFPFAPSDMVMRREYPFRAGLFQEGRIPTAEDTDLPCRMAMAGASYAGINRVLNYRAYHAGRRISNLHQIVDDIRVAIADIAADPRCPPEVRALGPRALKYHLLVAAVLALIQHETAPGIEWLREVIATDRGLLEGEPCELVHEMMAHAVADDSVDHVALLADIFAQLPEELRWLNRQEARAVAHGFLLKGFQADLWERPDAGRHYCAQAAQQRAVVDEAFLRYAAYQLDSYELEFGPAATTAALERIAPDLELVGGRPVVRRLRGYHAINQAFNRYANGAYANVPGSVFQALRNQPGFVLNRGVLSILVRSTFGAARTGAPAAA